MKAYTVPAGRKWKGGGEQERQGVLMSQLPVSRVTDPELPLGRLIHPFASFHCCGSLFVLFAFFCFETRFFMNPRLALNLLYNQGYLLTSEPSYSAFPVLALQVCNSTLSWGSKQGFVHVRRSTLSTEMFSQPH